MVRVTHILYVQYVGRIQRHQTRCFAILPCGTLVRAAARDAKRQGAQQLAVFKSLQKINPEEFAVAIMSFSAQLNVLTSNTNHKSYDWHRMYQSVQFNTRAQRGTDMVWMNPHAYAHHMSIQEGLANPGVFQKFRDKLITMPAADQVDKDNEIILICAGEFLVAMEETVQSDVVEVGYKDKTNPIGFDIKQSLDDCGNGRNSLDFEFFMDALQL